MRILNSIGLLPCIVLVLGAQVARAQSPEAAPAAKPTPAQSNPGAPPAGVPSTKEPRPGTTPASPPDAGEPKPVAPSTGLPTPDPAPGAPAAGLPVQETSPSAGQPIPGAAPSTTPPAGQTGPVTKPEAGNSHPYKPILVRPPLGTDPNANQHPAAGIEQPNANSRGPVTEPISSNNYLQINTDRVRRILVLRKLLALGMRSSDIASALPMLRSLRDINGAPNIDPAAAVEAEYQALLAAEPGKTLPESSAYKLTDAAQYYRDTQAKIWSSLEKKLGNAKAEGIRALIGQDGSNVRFQYDPNSNPDPNLVGKGHVTFMQGEFASGTATVVTETEPGKYVLSTQDGKIISKYDGPLSAAPSYFQRNRFNDRRGIYSQPLTVPYNPDTIHMSLSELIDLMEEKLRVMGRRAM